MIETNYWEIPISALPSHGTLYPEGAKIEFRCLNVRDLKFLAAINERNSRQMVYDILNRCLRFTNMTLNDVLEGDRLTLVFYIRTNTFQLSNSYQTEFVCPYCKNRISHEFQMSSLHVKTIGESNLRCIPLGSTKIHGVQRKITEKKFNASDRDVENILNWTDAAYEIGSSDLEKGILSLPADDFSRLKHLAEDAKFGIEPWTELSCSFCGSHLRVGVDLRDLNLFNRVKSTTMIRNQIEISKYCGIQINDDMPYNEVELLIATVNELAQQDAENLKKGTKATGGLAR